MTQSRILYVVLTFAVFVSTAGNPNSVLGQTQRLPRTATATPSSPRQNWKDLLDRAQQAFESKDYPGAEVFLQQARTAQNQILRFQIPTRGEPADPKWPDVSRLMAKIYRVQGKLPVACEAQRQALMERQRCLVKDDPAHIPILIETAEMEFACASQVPDGLTKSIEHYRRALELIDQNADIGADIKISTQVGLADALLAARNHVDEALKLLTDAGPKYAERAKALRTQQEGEKNILDNIWNDNMSKARTALESKEFDIAKVALEVALKAAEDDGIAGIKAKGRLPTTPTRRIPDAIAPARDPDGKITKRLEEQRKVLAERERDQYIQLLSKEPTTRLADTHQLFGEFYAALRKRDDAIRELETALKMHEVLLGGKNPALIRDIQLLAQVYLNNGEPRNAAAMNERVVELLSSVVDKADDVRKIRNRLVDYYSKEGPIEKAYPHALVIADESDPVRFEVISKVLLAYIASDAGKALVDIEKLPLAQKRLLLVPALDAVIDQKIHKGEYPDAHEAAIRLMNEVKQAKDKDEIAIAIAGMRIGQVCLYRMKFKDAEAELTKSVTILEKSKNSKSSNLRWLYNAIGYTYLVLDKQKEAIENYQKGFKLATNELGANIEVVRIGLNYAEALRTNGQTSEADKVFDTVEKIRLRLAMEKWKEWDKQMMADLEKRAAIAKSDAAYDARAAQSRMGNYLGAMGVTPELIDLERRRWLGQLRPGEE